MKPLSILLIISTLGLNSLKSQSVDSLFALAASNNLELQILEKEYLTALEKAPQVSQLPDPQVSLSLFPLPIETRLGPQILRLWAAQHIPWKGVLPAKKELALAEARVLREKVSVTELALFYQLKNAWLQWYEMEQSQQVIQRNRELLDALNNLTLAKVESGSTTSADVLKVQLKREELSQQLIRLEQSKAKPIAVINQLLNRPLDQPILLVDTLTLAIIPTDKMALLTTINEQHPTLKLFALQQEVAKKALQLNKLDSKPDFGFGVDYILTNRLANSFFENNGRDVIIPKVSVSVPLNKDKYAAKDRAERLKMETLETKKQDFRSRLMAYIKKATVDYEIAKSEVTFLENQKSLTEATIKILEIEYSTKGSKFDELLQLEMQLINYDLKILQQIIKSHQAKLEIERFLVPNIR